MCSVVGCESWRRSAQRFRLPEDPDRRLEWVQFLFEVNGQRLKESSWTDITICSEHFTSDCFETMTPGTVQLKPCVVPSLCIKSEQDEPLESPQYVEPVETICKREDSNTCNSPTDSEESKHILTDCKKKSTIDLNKEKAALLQMKGKFVVNESCLLQLFCRKCPSCGGKLQLEKVTYGLLIILNQQCLQCDYRYQWKSQVNASVPTEEDQTQQEIPTDDNPRRTVFSETVTFSDEESDPSDDGEEGDEGG
ncbi:hypothetical protein E3U43_002056, partial [Larimichthys crocea]